MPLWTIDVWFSTHFPVTADGDDWRRYVIDAPTPAAAQLDACQMVGHLGTPVRSVIVDWESGWGINVEYL